MKKSDLKRTFDSLSPPEELINKTKAMMLAANRQTADASEKRTDEKTATVLTPRPSRRKLWQSVSSCAAMLVLAAGMIFLYAQNGNYPTGGFSRTGAFNFVSGVSPAASYALRTNIPMRDYGSFRSEAVGEGNTATMSVTATILSSEVYTTTDESVGAYGFCLARISVDKVEKSDGLSIRKPRRGTALSIVIYLSDEGALGSLPQIGKSYDLLLATGKDGSQKDLLAEDVGMYDTWKCYDFEEK